MISEGESAEILHTKSTEKKEREREREREREEEEEENKRGKHVVLTYAENI